MAKKRRANNQTLYDVVVDGYKRTVPAMIVEGTCANCNRMFRREQYPGPRSRYCDACKDDPDRIRMEARERKRRQRGKG